MVRSKIILLAIIFQAVSLAQLPWTFNSTDLISSMATNLNSDFVFLQNNKVAKFAGSGPPGVITASTQGDDYNDTMNNVYYKCFGVTCTAVGAGNWQLQGGSVTVGNLTPLFTSNVVAGNAVTFALISQSQNLLYASPDGSSGNPTFRALAWHDFPSVAYTALTDAVTVSFNAANAYLASGKLTFTVHSGSRTLNVSNLVSGGKYEIELKQDSTGGEGLNLGTGCTWLVGSNGMGAITPSTGANAVDKLSFSYDGTFCYADFIKNYT